MSNEFRQHGVTIGKRKYITDEHGRFILVQDDNQEDE